MRRELLSVVLLPFATFMADEARAQERLVLSGGGSRGLAHVGLIVGLDSLGHDPNLGMERGRPEVEPINFLPRIKIPTIMLNAKYDQLFPTETSQKPFFRLLGSPPDRKRYVVYEGNIS